MKNKDAIAGGAAEAADTFSPLMQVEAQDLAAVKRVQAAEYLPFDVRKAKAWFPEGLDSSDGKCSSHTEVSEFLKSKRISYGEFTNHYAIKFVFDDGLAVSLTPSGTEDDSLDL